MNPAARLLLIGLAVVVVVVAVRLVGRWQRPRHPPVVLGDLGAEPGVVVFTSTECSNCREALTVVETFHVPIRQVSYELEAPELERAGVEAVPLTVVVGEQNAIFAVFAGVPRRRTLARAIAAAGLRGAR
jgi:hypothetical protein